MKQDELSSLFQGLDQMPDGLCYAKYGKPLYMNKTMEKIADTAFISGKNDMTVFDRLNEAGLKDGCRIEQIEGVQLLMLPDGGAWSIKTKTVSDGGQTYSEYAAYNTSELYKKLLELKRRNEHIEATNKKISEYSKEMDSVIRERELLDAKIKIHDDVGRALLSLRSYLYRENGDRDSLVKLWRYTVSVLRREITPDTSDNRIEALADAARAVDVSLELDGEIPDDPLIKEISAMAVRECLTNTVKHADGHNMYVKTRLCGNEYTVKIKNDGKKPNRPVEETGGLHTLRRAVRRYGGKMDIEWENGFELIITLYKAGKGEKNE